MASALSRHILGIRCYDAHPGSNSSVIFAFILCAFCENVFFIYIYYMVQSILLFLFSPFSLVKTCARCCVHISSQLKPSMPQGACTTSYLVL